jgi:hypothetical protein
MLGKWYDFAVAKCKLLAFLLCEGASVAPEPDNRVTLHHLFDRIILPRTSEKTDVTFVWAYYKIIVVDAPCTVALRVIDPQQREIRGNWRHSIGQTGPLQGVWALYMGLFKEPGSYVFELSEETDGAESHSLASTHLAVDLEGKQP